MHTTLYERRLTRFTFNNIYHCNGARKCIIGTFDAPVLQFNSESMSQALPLLYFSTDDMNPFQKRYFHKQQRAKLNLKHRQT